MAVETKDPGAKTTLNGGGAETPPPATPAARQAPDPLDPELKSAEAASGTNDAAKTAAPRNSQAPANNTQPSNPPESTATSTTTKVEVMTHQRSQEQIHNNPFDDYVDCIYNVSLGLLSRKAVKKLETSTRQSVTLTAGTDYTVFASTADARTSVNYEGDFYNIKSFSFTNFLAHMPQNPMVAVILDGKMKMVQPYGYSFREDIDEMADKGGYEILNPLNFIYRLEIWFSGYLPTGEWKANIPIPVYDGHQLDSIIYYLTVTAVEARVTSTGTEYDLSFQTAAHLALRAEMTMMHQDNVGALQNGSTVNYARGSTFGDFIQSLSLALRRQVYSDTQGKCDIEYQFYGPKWLFDDKFIEEGKVDFSHAVSFQPSTGTHAYTGSNMDILTLLNNVMDQLVLVRKLHLREDDVNLKEPGCLWSVRTNIAKVEGANPVIGNYGKYVFQYIIEPVLSFRSRMTETEDRNDKVGREAQFARAQAMKNFNMIVKVYDYLFTEDNSDIIEFQFLFKNFYYESYPYPTMPDGSPGAAGHDTADSPYKGPPKPKIDTSPPSVQFVSGVTTEQSVFQQLAMATPSASTSGQFKPASMQGGMSRETYLPPSQNMNPNERDRQKYQRSKRQYMQFDMINAQITVRFDPAWLLNPYMSGGDFTGELPGSQRKDDIFVYTHTDRVVFIKTYTPNQKNYMSNDFVNTQPKRAPILGGYYQVIQAVTEFEGGRFIQKLNMFKYPHMNYFNYDMTTTDAKTSGAIKTDSPTPTQPSTSPTPAATQPDPKKGLAS